MAEPIVGLDAAERMFDAMPDAVREQLGVEVAIIARDVLALQQVRAPKDTGTLEGSLGVLLLLDQLRARVGLIGKRNTFYGRIIEFGRSAQTVLVQRRRRVGGALRLSARRKRLEDVVATYKLRVKARAPQPFVLVPEPDLDAVADRRLADFWSQVIAHVGAGA